MALEFASLGAKHVALMDINEEALAKTKADVEKVVKEKDPYSDDPYAVELDPIELDL